MLKRLLWFLVYLLPAVLFFSYYPIISLGGSDSMNFELSLPLIWLVIFDIIAFVVLLSIQKNSVTRKHFYSRTPAGYDRGRDARHPRRRAVATSFLDKSIFSSLPGISDRRIFLFSLFPFFATISIFWSANPLRGILTAGIIWLLFFAVFAIIFILPLMDPPAKSRIIILRSLFISTTVVCIFCFLQGILDTCGVPRDQTLLCAGCTYRSFGFPHPSGFAIEPQFMGNLLLAPTLTTIYLLVFRHPKHPQPVNEKNTDAIVREHPQATMIGKENTTENSEIVPCFSKRSGLTRRTSAATLRRQASTTRFEKSQGTILLLLAAFFSLTLFFTFSRGAIYAYAVAIFVLLIFAIIRKSFRPALIAIPVVTFLLSLGLQGTFAHFGPTSETFTSAVTKSIHQLSLGLIDLRSLASASQPSSDDNNLTNPGLITDVEAGLDRIEDDLAPDSSVDDFIDDLEQGATIFEGYVAESTNIRLNLNALALDTILQTPRNFLIGVGLGGAGTAMYELFPDQLGSPKEIVQNQTFSLFVELGAVGIFLVHFALILAFFAPFLPSWLIDGKSARHSNGKNTDKKSPANQIPSQNLPQRLLSRLQISDFWSHPALSLLVALIVAYIITLNFFSGLPNALHIYLLPPLLYFVFRPTPENSQNKK